jgi:hypothetical protein
MANKALVRGLVAVPQRNQQIRYESIDMATSGAYDVFVGSVIQQTGGKAIALPYSGTAATAGAYLMLGVVAVIKNSLGRSCFNAPKAGTGYKLEYVPFDSDARFEVYTDGVSASFASVADIGYMYNLTEETSTASADQVGGDFASSCKLSGATKNATGRQFIIVSYDDEQGANTAGATTANCRVLVKANPANVQPV